MKRNDGAIELDAKACERACVCVCAVVSAPSGRAGNQKVVLVGARLHVCVCLKGFDLSPR